MLAPKKVLLELRHDLSSKTEAVILCTQKLRSAGFEVDFKEDFELQSGSESKLDSGLANAGGVGYTFGIALGGDGTFLTLAERLKGTDTPILGINFGHVGFLSDASSDDLLATIDRLVAGNLQTLERMTLQIEIRLPNGEIHQDWAINEAALEKAGIAGERFSMLNTRLEVDGTPLTSYGCDGVIVSTATGSTAHAFSAGGSIIWPSVECYEVVPVAAHSLFKTPVILGSESKLTLFVDSSAAGFGTLTMDGRRAYKVPTGSVIKIAKSPQILHFLEVSGVNFTEKLTHKFDLPIESWKQK